VTQLEPPLKSKTRSFLKKKGIIEIFSFIAVVGIWEFVAVFIVKNKFALPSFHSVVVSFFEFLSSGVMLMDILTSLLHLAIGLTAAVCIGIPIGAVTGWFRIADRIAYPIVEILRPIPPLAWIPFALIWLHLTHYAAGFIVFIGAMFPILVNTYAGFRNVPKILVESAKVLGCTKDHSLVRAVAFPSALPFITTGIRIGTGVGWMCIVAAEYFGVSKSGLGYRLWIEGYWLHHMDNFLAYMIAIGLVALFLDRFFRFLFEEKLLKWRKEIVV